MGVKKNLFGIADDFTVGLRRGFGVSPRFGKRKKARRRSRDEDCDFPKSRR